MEEISKETSRRQVLKAGAWALPVVALAVAVPAAAASTASCESQVFIFDPRTTTIEKGNNDQFKITIVTGSFIEFETIKEVEHFHFNIQYDKNGPTQNYHYPRKSLVGEKFPFPLDPKTCQDPHWIQPNSGNVHYYGNNDWH